MLKLARCHKSDIDVKQINFLACSWLEYGWLESYFDCNKGHRIWVVRINVIKLGLDRPVQSMN